MCVAPQTTDLGSATLNYADSVLTILHEVAHAEYDAVLGNLGVKNYQNTSARSYATEAHAYGAALRGLKKLKGAGKLSPKEFRALQKQLKAKWKAMKKKKRYSKDDIAEGRALIKTAKKAAQEAGRDAHAAAHTLEDRRVFSFIP